MSNVERMTDQEMLGILRQLCSAYTMASMPGKEGALATFEVDSLEPLAKVIGKELHRRGGSREMLRVFNQLGPMPGRRTLEMLWGGLGYRDWQG